VSRIVCDEAIVLRTAPWRETSKLVTVLTAGHGRLLLRAKGARRPRSRFGAALEIASRCRMIFYRGEVRPAYTLGEADLLDDFPVLRGSLDRLQAAAVLLEFSGRYLEPETPQPGLYRLLRAGLEALDGRDGSVQTLVTAFLLRAAAVLGFAPVLDRCAGCGRRRAAVFGPRHGGLLCAHCAAKEPDASRVSQDAIRQLTRLGSGSVAACLEEPVPQETADLVLRFLRFHIEGFELKSLRGSGAAQRRGSSRLGTAAPCTASTRP
jgi:DNA repair protein RecO (recombination protein O)